MNEIRMATAKPTCSGFNSINPPPLKRLSTRLATEKDYEAIWNLYLQTNFLYPEKLAAMPDNGRQAKENLKKLLSLNSELFRVLLCENQSSELLAVCTHARYSAAQSHVMHLASTGNIKALLHIFKASQEISMQCSADFISYTFRPNNAGVRRLFVSVLKEVKVEFENETYDYYKFFASDLKTFKAPANGFQIEAASEQDRLYLLQNCADETQKTVLNSVGRIDDSTVSDVSKVFDSIGFLRRRKAVSIKKDGLLQGMAIIEAGPDWWNFSGLGNGIRLFMLNEDEEISRRLLAAAVKHLSDFPLACWTMLVAPRQTGLTKVLSTLGFTSDKQYQRITLPQTLTNFIYTNYGDFIERKKRGIL